MRKASTVIVTVLLAACADGTGPLEPPAPQFDHELAYCLAMGMNLEQCNMTLESIERLERSGDPVCEQLGENLDERFHDLGITLEEPYPGAWECTRDYCMLGLAPPDGLMYINPVTFDNEYIFRANLAHEEIHASTWLGHEVDETGQRTVVPDDIDRLGKFCADSSAN